MEKDSYGVKDEGRIMVCENGVNRSYDRCAKGRSSVGYDLLRYSVTGCRRHQCVDDRFPLRGGL